MFSGESAVVACTQSCDKTFGDEQNNQACFVGCGRIKKPDDGTDLTPASSFMDLMNSMMNRMPMQGGMHMDMDHMPMKGGMMGMDMNRMPMKGGMEMDMSFPELRPIGPGADFDLNGGMDSKIGEGFPFNIMRHFNDMLSGPAANGENRVVKIVRGEDGQPLAVTDITRTINGEEVQSVHFEDKMLPNGAFPVRFLPPYIPTTVRPAFADAVGLPRGEDDREWDRRSEDGDHEDEKDEGGIFLRCFGRNSMWRHRRTVHILMGVMFVLLIVSTGVWFCQRRRLRLIQQQRRAMIWTVNEKKSAGDDISIVSLPPPYMEEEKKGEIIFAAQVNEENAVCPNPQTQ